MIWNSDTPLILASQSKARHGMLCNVGLKFTSIPADIDEERYKSGPDTSLVLARKKAEAVSACHDDALVIGSDQILLFEGEILSKAPDRGAAIDKLKKLQGKSHALISAVSVYQNGAERFYFEGRADLVMRAFDDDFLTHYAEITGDDILTGCVGAYALEAHGSWLFEKIDGDFFTILGMPLLPLLGFLREETA